VTDHAHRRTALDYSIGDVQNADLYIFSPQQFTVFISDPCPQQQACYIRSTVRLGLVCVLL